MNLLKIVFPSLSFDRWAKVAVTPIVTAFSSPSLAPSFVLGPAQVSAAWLIRPLLEAIMSKKKLYQTTAALLPMFFAAVFCSSTRLLADDLGTASISGKVDATCTVCTEQYNGGGGNVSVGTAYSSAQTTLVETQDPSISARSEADVTNGGALGANFFGSGATAKVGLDYYFEINGPNNISIPVLVTANGSIIVTGNFASTGYSYVSAASLFIGEGPQILFNEDLSLETGGSNTNKSGSFSLGQSFNLQTNTPYEVNMLVSTSASAGTIYGQTALADLIATASIDPSFQLSADAPSGYSIVFSDGIGDTPTATPLPATLPLFAGGLGFVGYLTRRKKRGTSPLATA